MKTENEKCGEILRCNPGKFIFRCAYCLECFDSNSKTIALDHIENHFLTETVCSTNELEIKSEQSNNDLPDVIDDQTTNQRFTANHIETTVLIEIGILPVHESFSLKDPLSNLCNLANTIKEEPKYTITNEEVSILNTKSKRNSGWTEQELLSSKNKSIVECDICGKTLVKKSLYDHMRVHSNLKKFKCLGCSKKYNTRPALFKHAKIHRDPKLQKIDRINNLRFPRRTWGLSSVKRIVECDICKKTMQKDGIEKHMLAHANLREFVCSVCEKGFNNINQLKVHESIHSGIKEFSCHVCAAQFRVKKDLTAHIRVHTGEKPYECNFCDKKYSHPRTLKEHKRIHTGERPHICDVCGKTFRNYYSYKLHLNLHTKAKKFKCDLCANSFTSGRLLREHRRTHTGERPFICTVCDQAFARRNAYHQHTILHTGKKPYKCRFCDLKFSQGAGRRSHERSVHKDSKKKLTIYGIINDTT